MKKHINGFAIVMVFVLLFLGISFPGEASENREEIDRVTIEIKADVPEGGGSASLDVNAESDRYTVDSFQFSGGKTSFKSGEVPKVNIVLAAEDGFQFDTKLTRKKFSIRGDGICDSIRRIDSGLRLEITVRLNPVAVTVGKISGAYWSDSPVGKAKWDSAQNAGAYELILFYKDSVVKQVEKTTTTVFDFHHYMTKTGDYYYKVRTIPRNSEESSYIEPGEWVISPKLFIDGSQVSNPQGSTQQNPSYPGGEQVGPGAAEGAGSGRLSDGSFGGWRKEERGWKYQDRDGGSLSNIWKLIDGKWYFFDMMGYMKTGWLDRNGGYYYLTVNGDMVTGWLELDRKWYYLSSEGLMKTGWLELDGTWYFLNITGTMSTGWQNVNDKWYYFDPVSGAMAVNTAVGGFYVGSNGAMVSK